MVRELESYADQFVRQRLLGHCADGVRAVAELLNLQPSQCALVDNATTAVSNLLDLCVKPDDTILVNSWTYGAVKLAAELIGDPNLLEPGSHSKRKTVKIQFKLPLTSSEHVIELAQAALDRHPEIKIAIFDHITSGTACVMPVRELTEVCHARRIAVIIDGAHAIGQIPNLDIPGIGADFYVGNLHKWLFAPKSAALLWTRVDFEERLRPSVVSWLVHERELGLRYSFLGTRDTSSFCVVAQAVEFARDTCGGLERIHTYCSQLADEASQHLVDTWGSHMLPIPTEMQAPFMRLIALPGHLQCQEILEMTQESKMMSPMWNFVLNKLKMDVLFLNMEGKLYIRISFSIIVCMDDIRKLGETMMRLTKKDFTG